jgi:cytochrome oxidase Cu insertion factor (SCO1/SenC/PrrC family)
MSLVLWRMADREVPGAGAAASIGGPFVLTDQNGTKRSDKDFRGHWVLLYFGYTYCPDVCPTTLALIASALGKLGSGANRVVPVFITVDPERDTPPVLKSYLAAFGPQFVGLTGSVSDIADVAHAYRIYFKKVPVQGGGYSLDHSSAILLLDPNGHFVKAYDEQSGAAAIANDLKQQFQLR